MEREEVRKLCLPDLQGECSLGNCSHRSPGPICENSPRQRPPASCCWWLHKVQLPTCGQVNKALLCHQTPGHRCFVQYTKNDYNWPGVRIHISVVPTVCRQNHIHHMLTAVAAPHGNGQIERFNRSILSAFRAAALKEDKWDQQVLDATLYHVSTIAISILKNVYHCFCKLF